MAEHNIPRTEVDITPEWLSSVLKTPISGESLTLTSNIQKGSGNLSNMVRIRCKSSTDKKDEFKVIAKLLPQEGIMRDLVISEAFDKTEICFYQILVPELINILPTLEAFLCHFYYGQFSKPSETAEYASVVVLDDLSADGYYTINFAQDETSEQIQSVVTFMAKFHFAGMALEDKKGQRLDQVYDFLQGTDIKESSMFYEMAKAGFPVVIELLTERGACPEVIKGYRNLSSHSDKIIAHVQEEGYKLACLIHGDLWSSNLMFNKSKDKHTKVIDWQLAGYKDPSYDVVVTVISSLPQDKLRIEDFDELLRLYYDTWVETCKKGGMGHLVNRDWESFKTFCYTWGASYTMLWCLMATEPFAVNYPRIVAIYEFLARDLKVTDFLMRYL